MQTQGGGVNNDYEFRGEGLYRAVCHVPFLLSVHCLPTLDPSLLSAHIIPYGEGRDRTEAGKVNVRRYDGGAGVCFLYTVDRPGVVAVSILLRGFGIVKREVWEGKEGSNGE